MKKTLDKYKNLIIYLSIIALGVIAVTFFTVMNKEVIQEKNANINSAAQEYYSDLKSSEVVPKEEKLNNEGYSIVYLYEDDTLSKIKENLKKSELESAILNKANYVTYAIKDNGNARIPHPSLLKAIDEWNKLHKDDQVNYKKLVGVE